VSRLALKAEMMVPISKSLSFIVFVLLPLLPFREDLLSAECGPGGVEEEQVGCE
jgi:hypothetical protein